MLDQPHCFENLQMNNLERKACGLMYRDLAHIETDDNATIVFVFSSTQGKQQRIPVSAFTDSTADDFNVLLKEVNALFKKNACELSGEVKLKCSSCSQVAFETISSITTCDCICPSCTCEKRRLLREKLQSQNFSPITMMLAIMGLALIVMLCTANWSNLNKIY